MAREKDNAEWVHQMEQSNASARALGSTLSALYHGLLADKVPAEHAVRIVCDYVRGMAAGSTGGGAG